MFSGDTPISEKSETRAALLAYCDRDTETMIHVFDKLLDESAAKISPSLPNVDFN